MELSNEFNFYSHLSIIIKEIEEKDDYDDNIILKRLIYLTSCELSSCFLDNVFVFSKLKFLDFDDNKKYSKAMLDIFYQILKIFNAFQYKCVVNLFETLSLGNFDTNDMVFFLKVLFTFYYTHELTMLSLEKNCGVNDYEPMFKVQFEKGFEKMKDIICIIPLALLLELEQDEQYISIMFRVKCDDNKRTNTTSLPPIRQKSANNNNNGNQLNNSGFFTTSSITGTKIKHDVEISKNNNMESARSKSNFNYKI